MLPIIILCLIVYAGAAGKEFNIICNLTTSARFSIPLSDWRNVCAFKTFGGLYNSFPIPCSPFFASSSDAPSIHFYDNVDVWLSENKLSFLSLSIMIFLSLFSLRFTAFFLQCVNDNFAEISHFSHTSDLAVWFPIFDCVSFDIMVYHGTNSFAYRLAPGFFLSAESALES